MASWFPDSFNESGLTRFLRLIRFSHTVFALPFALGALLVATHGRPSLRLLTLVLLCMVCARTAAMLFNRLADWTLDQRNPRTATRHQLISRPVALLLLGLSSAAFVAAAAADQPHHLSPHPARARHHFFLFPDEALHRREPFFSRRRARRRAGGRLDRRDRPADPCSASSLAPESSGGWRDLI